MKEPALPLNAKLGMRAAFSSKSGAEQKPLNASSCCVIVEVG